MVDLSAAGTRVTVDCVEFTKCGDVEGCGEAVAVVVVDVMAFDWCEIEASCVCTGEAE